MIYLLIFEIYPHLFIDHLLLYMFTLQYPCWKGLQMLLSRKLVNAFSCHIVQALHGDLYT